MKERSALAGSLIAGLLASACCIGPLLLVAVGLGSLGFATALAPLRPWLLGLTAILLGFGFHLAYRRPKAESCADGEACAEPVSRRGQRITLWVVTALAAGLASYPSWGARLTPARPTASPVAAVASLVVLDVRGMTCTGCEAEIERELVMVPGVVNATVSYQRKRAEIRVATGAVAVAPLIAAVEKAGYRAASVQDR